MYPATKGNTRDTDYLSKEKDSRRKPAKLDLSMLFPRPRRNGGKSADSISSTPSISSMSTNASHTPTESTRAKKLSKSKTKSKESLQSYPTSVRTSHTHDSGPHRQAASDLYNLHDHYEQTIASPRMSKIPEARVPSNRAALQREEDIMLFRHDSSATRLTIHSKQPSNGTNSGITVREPFSWKNVRSSMVPQGQESPSMHFPQQRVAPKPASITSRTSKTSKASRHTNASGISNSDLQLKSVLSLSSDSEGDNWEKDAGRSSSVVSRKATRGSSKGVSHASRERMGEDRSYQLPLSGGLSPRSQGSRRPSAPPTVQGTAHLAVPGNYSVPLSPPWTEPREDSSGSSINYQSHRRQPSQPKDKKTPKKASSLASVRSAHSQQPTPPLSPTSIDLGEISERTSRFMAVTRQEEALLEALRLKRARMREKIIEEHEIRKSPPRSHGRENDGYLEPSSLNTAHNVPDERQRILEYLDTPQPKSRRAAEPLPDLNDFISFGSDDDSTPRGSYVAPMAKARPEMAPRTRNHKTPRTPPPAVRLSAVGGVEGFKVPENGRKKRNNDGVRFAEDQKLQSHQDFLMDESETEVMYNY
jgi:hypothetical protein